MSEQQNLNNKNISENASVSPKNSSKKFFYLFLTLIFLAFSAYEYIHQYKLQIFSISSNLDKTLIQSEHIFKTCSGYVDSFQKSAETFYLLDPKENEFTRLIKIAKETKIPQQQKIFYTLDFFPLPYSKEMIGNLRGTGSLKRRNRQYYREIKMALGLNNIFRAAVDSLPNVVWAYYVSKNEFINIYPWEHSNSISSKPEEIYHYIAELLTLEFYKFGLPENNPLRKLFWTPAYIDTAGKGMMITCSKPVYGGQNFLGTVSADLTLDFLNSLLADFRANSEYGEILIVNNYKQIIAHPALIKSSDKELKLLKSAIPKNISSKLDELLEKNFEGQTKIKDYMVFIRNYKSAPYKIIYFTPSSEIYGSMDYKTIAFAAIIFVFSIYIIKSRFDKNK
ncbi:MAG TPA: hypothetical protein PKY81_05270 [bacterium]|nr:hypothetical protein [bacterium]HPN30348.1 hypothetical protein [bacterium]